MQDFTIIQWTTLALAAAAVALNLFALRRNAATNRRIDRLPKPAWMGKWPPQAGSILDDRWDYSHLPCDAQSEPARLSVEELRQCACNGSGEDKHHLKGGGPQSPSPTALVQVVRPTNQGGSALRSQSNAVNENGQASTGSNACIREETGLEQFGTSPALGTSCLQVLQPRHALALRHLQYADVQRQIDRPVFDVSHLDRPVCGGQQRRGEGDNSTGIGTALPGMDSTGAYPDEVAKNSGPSTTNATPSAP